MKTLRTILKPFFACSTKRELMLLFMLLSVIGVKAQVVGDTLWADTTVLEVGKTYIIGEASKMYKVQFTAPADGFLSITPSQKVSQFGFKINGSPLYHYTQVYIDGVRSGGIDKKGMAAGSIFTGTYYISGTPSAENTYSFTVSFEEGIPYSPLTMTLANPAEGDKWSGAVQYKNYGKNGVPHYEFSSIISSDMTASVKIGEKVYFPIKCTVDSYYPKLDITALPDTLSKAIAEGLIKAGETFTVTLSNIKDKEFPINTMTDTTFTYTLASAACTGVTPASSRYRTTLPEEVVFSFDGFVFIENARFYLVNKMTNDSTELTGATVEGLDVKIPVPAVEGLLPKSYEVIAVGVTNEQGEVVTYGETEGQLTVYYETSNSYFKATTSPKNNANMTSLKTYTVTLPSAVVYDASLASTSEITFGKHNESTYSYDAISGLTVDYVINENVITVTLSEEITAPGDYRLEIPSKLFWAEETYDKDNLSTSSCYYLTNTYIYCTILPYGPSTVTPANCSTVGRLNVITLNFDENVLYDEAALVTVIRETEVSDGFMFETVMDTIAQVGISDNHEDNTQLSINVGKIDSTGTYKVVVPEGAIWTEKDENKKIGEWTYAYYVDGTFSAIVDSLDTLIEKAIVWKGELNADDEMHAQVIATLDQMIPAAQAVADTPESVEQVEQMITDVTATLGTYMPMIEQYDAKVLANTAIDAAKKLLATYTEYTDEVGFVAAINTAQTVLVDVNLGEATVEELNAAVNALTVAQEAFVLENTDTTVAIGTEFNDMDVSVIWAFTDSITETPSVSPRKVFSEMNVSAGSMTLGTASAKGVNYITVRPEDTTDTTVTWSVTPLHGLTFTPTRVCAKIQRFGTNGGQIDVIARTNKGTDTLATDLIPLRNLYTLEEDKYAGNDKLCDEFQLDVPASLATRKSFTLAAVIKNLGSTKQIGFSDVRIYGTVNGTVSEPINVDELVSLIAEAVAWKDELNASDEMHAQVITTLEQMIPAAQAVADDPESVAQVEQMVADVSSTLGTYKPMIAKYDAATVATVAVDEAQLLYDSYKNPTDSVGFAISIQSVREGIELLNDPLVPISIEELASRVVVMKEAQEAFVLENTPTGPKVAYLCGATETTEAIYTALVNAGYWVTTMNYNNKSLNDSIVNADFVGKYEVVVLAGNTGSSSNLAKTANLLLGKMNVLSTKTFWYKHYGTNGSNPGTAETPSRNMIKVAGYEEHPIYTGIKGNEFTVFNDMGKTTGRYLQSNGSFANGPEQKTLGTTNGENCIGEAWIDSKGWIIIPVDGAQPAGYLTSDGEALFVNAINYLIAGEEYERTIIDVESITVSVKNVNLEEGETYTLTATVTPDNATDKTIIWYSSNESVATVSDGVVTAVGSGESYIVARAGIYVDTCVVSVNPVYTPADVNGDSIVSIVDVVAVVNNILGRSVGNFIFDAADMDQNGQITIVDVVAVVNVLLGKDALASGARSILHSDIHVADAEVNAGETTTLYVKLDHAQAYTAMQMDVNLPEGLSIDGVKMVGNPSHAVVYNEEGRIAAYSLNNSRFNDGETLMAVTVKADKDFTGTAQADFTNVRVVSTDMVETVLAGASASIAGGGADGIDGVTTDENVQVLYYSTTGAVSDTPHKGLNIIKRIYGDGRVIISKGVNQ